MSVQPTHIFSLKSVFKITFLKLFCIETLELNPECSLCKLIFDSKLEFGTLRNPPRNPEIFGCFFAELGGVFGGSVP